jgi:hypothetical protein
MHQAGYINIVRVIMKVHERLGKKLQEQCGLGMKQKHRELSMFPGDFKTSAILWERNNLGDS